MNIFEQASRLKLRFQYKGTIGVEELWDLDVEKSLNEIYMNLTRDAEQVTGKSLLKKPSKAVDILNLKIAIIEHIANVKEEEAKARSELAEKITLKRRILEEKASRSDQALKGKSDEELDAILAGL